MRRIVPEKHEGIPGVCGTANFFMERSKKLDAIVQALVIGARATPEGVELTIEVDAEVEGVPLPWMVGLSIPDGAPAFVTVDAGTKATVKLAGSVGKGSIELRISQGDVMKTKSLAL